MFIEIKDGQRINSDKISLIEHRGKNVLIYVADIFHDLEFASEDDAKLYLAGLDRLLGVKEPMYVKK